MCSDVVAFGLKGAGYDLRELVNNDISSWQGGDIIIFKKHIGIVSDKRNSKGIPSLFIMLIHINYIMKKIYYKIEMIL